jgi:hypothetical protein
MKKLTIFLVIIQFITSSCLKENSNYTRFTGNINVDSIQVPDTVVLGESVTVKAQGGAPNSCWSKLELMLSQENDSLVLITGIGWFESYDGICNDIYLKVDSSFTYKPTDTGKIMFLGLSPGNRIKMDSLIVVPE